MASPSAQRLLGAGGTLLKDHPNPAHPLLDLIDGASMAAICVKAAAHELVLITRVSILWARGRRHHF